MSVDISVNITEDLVDIIATPTVNIVNVTNSASIDPGLYDLSEFTNTSVNPFVRTSGLSAYVPTTRTLTINGTTQDLSADRTFTVSTGITIGTTAITSGTVGRVLFEGTGNVVQESANMTYDNTNLIFTLGSTATRILNFRPQDTTGAYGNSCSIRGGISNGRLDFYSGSNITELRDNIILLTSATGPSIQVGTASINLNVGGTRLQVAPTTGNILIGTTTDAGFKLDVNGTARVSDNLLLTNGIIATSTATTRLQGSTNYFTHNRLGSSGALGFQISQTGTISSFWRWSDATDAVEFGNARNAPVALFTNNTEKMRIVGNGSVLINTTTDSGFLLDVNGTARIATSLTVTTGKAFSGYNSGGTASDALKLELTGNGAVLGIQNSNASGFSGVEYLNNAGAPRVFTGFNNSNGQEFRFNNFATGGYIDFLIGGTSSFRVFNSRNVGIGTTTDAGFKLDVNGTARFSGTNYQVVLQTTSNGIIKAQGGYQNTDGSYTADGNLFLKAGISGSGNLYITPNNGNTTAFGLFANGTGFNIGLGLSTVASASFQINSTTQGFLPPRGTNAQMLAIASPAKGLVFFDNTNNKLNCYDGTTWQPCW